MDSKIIDGYPIGSRPAIHYLPYLIFISYIVSFIGSFTTVELLHRRVGGTGWRNWVQLAACSVSFGLVAIWCMHFVGNRAIVLGQGEEEIQLYYSHTFTAVSAFLPIVVIFIGLLVADRFQKGSRGTTTRFSSLLVCGVLVGAAVTEMHYLGNYGTTHYIFEPKWQYIIGAAATAVGASTIAFGLFFHWSGLWMNTLWRRVLVASFLALAVSGLHWTAAAGTTYKLLGYHQGPGGGRNANLIIAVCLVSRLCLGACGVCFAMGFLKQHHDKKLKDRAQQVVLAVATFDEAGRLLVNQSGLLPCQTITRQWQQKTFDDDFNNAHPVFQWIYRVSRNWGGITDLIPAMREHLQKTGYLRTHNPVIGSGSRPSTGDEDNSSYSATFRELFCVTAQEIAKNMETRLQDLGYLFDDVLTTGTLLSKMIRTPTYPNDKRIISADPISVQHDAESGLAKPILFGKGQLLVLTRKVGAAEVSRLENVGYRFAYMDQVSENLARSLHVSRPDLKLLVTRLQLFCERKPWNPSDGAYLASFLLQPSPVMKGLDVIVPGHNPDRLPMVELVEGDLSTRQTQLLHMYEGFSLDECLARIIQGHGSATEDDDVFLQKFSTRIHKLIREVPEAVLRRAIFSSRGLKVSHGTHGQGPGSDAVVFAFCGIKDVYNQSLKSQTLKYVPLSFFQCHERIYPGCPDHAILAQKNHKEFSTLHTATVIDHRTPSEYSSSRWPKRWQLSKSPPMSDSEVHPDSSSQKGLFNMTSVSSESANISSHPFGGIMVSQDIVVNEDRQKSNCQVELTNMGVYSEAGVAEKEQETLAETLMSITQSFHDPNSRNMR
ncbi:hypothetical protein P154DRAFT_430518 [Amniculicola lignicola CBS 123094]|uniref:MHYT domain-containing protein n=1 Tax=Amniculicola lignicola CBS 123094 TaxID=1392246 RepID=A0A6A5WLL4_9PLEO|nr:hypothetical protein P154DRAFT_430518 [Amniculicola lignicola CBS 123094]